MKKKIIFLSFFLCIAKLFAHTNIQIIAPIISQCLIHISPNNKNVNTIGLALNFQAYSDERNWGLYTSFAFASNDSFNLDNTGLKFAIGPVFKINETEKYYMNIGIAPQFVFNHNYKNNLIYLGYEIDFQTKFIPDKKISPIIGVYSATNFALPKKDKDERGDSYSIDNPEYNVSYNKSFSNFYLDIGIQVYLALSINFN